MRTRTATFIVLGAIAAPAAGVALATPPVGLNSELLARGAADELRIRDGSMGLSLTARQKTDVAVVRATLEPRGTTGWHGHPGPSIVVVKTGTLTMLEPGGRHGYGRHDGAAEASTRHPRCLTREFGPGKAFVHPEQAHTFENRTDAVAEFYVVYLVPRGATPLLNDVDPAPPQCS